MLDIPPADTGDARLHALLLRQEVENSTPPMLQRSMSNASPTGPRCSRRMLSTSSSRARTKSDGMPVGLIYCDSKRMLYDRAFALEKTTMFAPRYLRHMISNLRILGEDAGRDPGTRKLCHCFRCCTTGPMPRLHQVGVYHDVFRRVNGALKLAERRCIYDSLLIDNALCLPV